VATSAAQTAGRGRTSTGERRSWQRCPGYAKVTGAERANPATLKRFIYRFARFNLSETALRPSHGIEEAKLSVATGGPGRRPKSICFGHRHLSGGPAKRCESEAEETLGAQLVSPSPGKSAGPWLRPGDLGVIFEKRCLNHEFTRLNDQI
jgi:hypothetical protein